MKIKVISIIMLSVSFMLMSCKQPHSAKDLILLMQLKSDLYGFNSLKFSQYYDVPGKPLTIWQEYYEAAGKLRITFDSLSSGNGMLFRNDSLYYYQNDSLIMARLQVHDLLLLAYDVYNISPFEVFGKLKLMNYDLNYVRDSVFDGKKVYIGGKAVNTRDNAYFIIDCDSLLLRKIYRNHQGRETVVLLRDYKIFDGKPIATAISFYRNGKLEAEERYFDIEMQARIPKQIFDPSNARF